MLHVANINCSHSCIVSFGAYGKSLVTSYVKTIRLFGRNNEFFKILQN